MTNTERPETVMCWQYCRDGFEITGQMYDADDADMVRAWQTGINGDFCLVEVTRGTGRWAHRWKLTGGDGDWTKAANRTHASPADALTAVLGETPWREADESDEANGDAR